MAMFYNICLYHSACEPLWTTSPSTAYSGGVGIPDVLGRQTCLMHCATTPGCYGVDIDMTPGNLLCWVHDSPPTDMQIVSNNNKVTHYKLIKGCVGKYHRILNYDINND